MRKQFTLLALLLISTLPAFAEKFTAGGITYNTISADAVEVTTSDTKYTGAIDIPATVEYNGTIYDVTKIGNNAFYGSTLSSISIGENITTIGDNALRSTNIRSITIGENIKTIGGAAFYACTNLTSAILGKNVMTIGNIAFGGCPNLATLTISEENTKYHSINNCIVETATKTLVVGSKASIIPTDESVTSIGNYAFQYVTGFTSITIPDNITKIGEYAFGSSSLKSVDIGEGVTTITTNAFRGCTNLTSVIIGENVKTIGNCAFYQCTNLTSITLGKSVASIGSGTLGNCPKLETLIVAEGNAKYHSIDNCLIETATKTLVLGCKGSTIPTDESVTIIGNYAFQYASGFSSITIPDNITKIGEYAFGSSTLKSVAIGDGVTTIVTNAFRGCTNLTSVLVGENVKTIGNCAFYQCTNLTSITLGKNIATIGSGAFGGCSKLATLTVDEENTKYHSINNCLIETATKTLILGCKGSTIPADESVTSIGTSAFQYLSGLTSIMIPDNITKIGTYAFANSNISSVVMGDSVTSIGNQAFGACGSLTSVTMGKNVKTLADYVFYNSSRLTSITCHAVIPPTAKTTTFQGVPGTATITVPCGSTESYQAATGWKTFTNYEEVFVANFSVVSADETQGSVSIMKTPTSCDDATAIFSATPAEHYQFVKWSDGVTTAEREVEITKDTVFTAEFALTQHTITLVAENGTISGAESDTKYDYGTKLTLIATANEHYQFVKWSDGVTSAEREVEITQDTTFTAEFAPIMFTITATANSPEYGTVTGGTDYQEGVEAILTATANDGYEFMKWTDSKGNTYDEDTLIFTVTENEDYLAIFAKKSVGTGLPDTRDSILDTRKVLENGTIYIFRNGEKYTIDGRKL